MPDERSVGAVLRNWYTSLPELMRLVRRYGRSPAWFLLLFVIAACVWVAATPALVINHLWRKYSVRRTGF